ncbi:hypothetical protein ACIOD0_33785 [Kitasatospora albolonga]
MASQKSPPPAQAAVHCVSTRTIAMFTSTDSTETVAIDGNNNSFSRSRTSSTALNIQPNYVAQGSFSGDFTHSLKTPSSHGEWLRHRS